MLSRFAGVLLLLGSALFIAAPALAQEEVQLTGEVLDLACYMHHGKKGPSHRACAVSCAKNGTPIGLLTDEGDVYLLLEDHADEDPYEEAKKLAGRRASVTGLKFVKPGLTGVVLSATKGE